MALKFVKLTAYRVTKYVGGHGLHGKLPLFSYAN